MKGKTIFILVLTLVLVIIIVLLVITQIIPKNVIKSADSFQIKSDSNIVDESTYKKYEGNFNCENSTIEVRYLGNNQYEVTFKGTGFIDGKQVRIMELNPDKNILYIKDKPNSGGLIYSKDFQSIQDVDGSDATFTYKRI
jgi:hypothetical protein